MKEDSVDKKKNVQMLRNEKMFRCKFYTHFPLCRNNINLDESQMGMRCLNKELSHRKTSYSRYMSSLDYFTGIIKLNY